MINTENLNSITPKIKIDPIKLWSDIERKTEEIKFNYLSSNKATHRFTDIFCPSETAIKLQNREIYLHANAVKMIDGVTTILTQAPTLETQELFWNVCLEKSRIIVDLTNVNDAITPYYPTKVNQTKKIDSIEITLDKQEKKNSDTIEINRYTVKDTKTNLKKTVYRVRYLDWKDFSGTAADDLIYLIDEVDQIAQEISNHDPIMVHCRAGVGRAGTLITVRTLKNLIQQGKINNENLVRILQKIIFMGRQQRGRGFVQRLTQLETIIECAEKILAVAMQSFTERP